MRFSSTGCFLICMPSFQPKATAARVRSLQKTIQARLDGNMLKNFMHTAVLQGFNYLFPVLLLPVLIRAIGPAKYAEMIYFQGIASMMIVLTDFGFNTTAVRDISLAKISDRDQMRTIFLRTQYVKGMLFGFSLVLALAYCFVFNLGMYRTLLLLSSCLIVVGQIVIPTYFFLAIEKMVYITYSLIVARGVYILLLILLVRTPDDFVLVNPLMGLCYIAAGAYLHYVIFKRYMSCLLYTSPSPRD